MRNIFHLFQFIAEDLSRFDAEINSAGVAREKPRLSESPVLIPFRSPNDQQQVFIIRTPRQEAGHSPNFVDYND